MGNLKTPEVLLYLEQALRERRTPFGTTAAMALRQIGTPEAMAILDKWEAGQL
jgi:hypothetical protein